MGDSHCGAYRVAAQSAKINDNHNMTWHYTFGKAQAKMADFCGFQHLNSKRCFCTLAV
jgi:hypothetical protein